MGRAALGTSCLYLLPFVLLVQAVPHRTTAELQADLQDVIDTWSNRSSDPVAITLGAALPSGDRIVLASGIKDQDGTWAAPHNKFAVGSLTKMVTAGAVLRLVDEGEFELDSKAFPLFDPLYRASNGSSSVDFFGPQIQNVTVRQLLGMSSGVPDFDTQASRNYQLQHFEEDLDPWQNLEFLEPGQWNCAPGNCSEYSSSNFELLGLILAQAANASSWDSYDQSLGVPADLLAEMPDLTFAIHGTCGNYTDVHGWCVPQVPGAPIDVSYLSCTNGWACGNVLASADDMAFYTRALLGSDRVLKQATREAMVKTKPFTIGWRVGFPYGLGLMDLSQFVKKGVDSGAFLGHQGSTYGFQSTSGYMTGVDVGLTLMINSEYFGGFARVVADAFDVLAAHFGGPASIVA